MSTQTLVNTPDTHSVEHTANADLQTRTEASRRHLHDMGYTAGITTPGRVSFVYGTREYELTLKDDDAEYFAITQNLWRASNRTEERHAATAARIAERIEKNARITIENRNVIVTVESNLPSNETFPQTFQHCFDALQRVIKEYVSIITELLPRPPKKPLPITKRVRANAYLNYLTSYGYAAKIDNNDDIVFTADGREYRLFPDDMWDDELIIAARGGIMTITDPNQRTLAGKIIEHATEGLRNVLVYMTETGRVNAITKVYLSNPLDLRVHFPLGFGQLLTAMKRFQTRMAAAQTATA